MTLPLPRLAPLLVSASMVAASAGAACALLDPPSQCASDGDCVRFNAVCNVREAVCVSREDADGGAGPATDTSSAQVEAAEDAAALPSPCAVSPKPTASVATGLPAVFDGGVQVADSLSLGCEKDWTLEGQLVIGANATLTIAPGTTIRAKKGTNAGIIVLPGGRIVAEGQKNAPVVMTVDDPAPKPGDWRGLIVLGRAPRTGTNPHNGDPRLQYGGKDANDNSGTLTFVRIEYPRDGLVLGALGKQTKLDSIQVRRSNDNCFSINGGSFDAKHLVCQESRDEHFEIQQGYAGRMQFLFGQKVSPGDGHNGILVDGEVTLPVIYNATVCGQSQAQNVGGHGLAFRNKAKLDANDMVITGWLSGVDAQSGNLGTPLLLRSSISFGNALNPVSDEDGGAGPLANDDNGFDELAFFNSGGNVTTDPKLVDCHSATAPKPWPEAPLVAGARPPPNDGFFDADAAYIGAFKDENDAWMTGAWVRFDDE